MKNRVMRKRAQGFTMLEAVIALLILSIGMLGLAGLQSTSTRLTTESHQRSITTLAASEIIDKIRMRTGKQPRADRPGIITSYTTTAPTAGECNALSSALADELGCWQLTLKEQLPEGKGEIFDNLNGNVTVRISWTDRETGVTESIDWRYMVGSL